METLVAFHLLADHGWTLSQYDSLPPREKRLTNEMVLYELNQKRKQAKKAAGKRGETWLR